MTRRIYTHPWEFHTAPFCIAGNLYYVGNKLVSCHLIDSGAGLILIDTAFFQSVYLLLESIRQLGFDPGEIKYIVHTHGHVDHVAGTRALVELTGARTFLRKEDLELLEDGHGRITPFDIDNLLSDEEVIRLGNTEISPIHTPGHTDGTISLFFNVKEKGKSYNAGLYGGFGLNSLTDQWLKKYNRSELCREMYYQSLEKVSAMNVDILLGSHPGQNDTFGKKMRKTADHNPFIDQSAWTEFISDLKKKYKDTFCI